MQLIPLIKSFVAATLLCSILAAPQRAQSRELDLVSASPQTVSPRDTKTVRLELGPGKVNVGILYGGDLYNAIYTAIARACSVQEDSSKCDKTQSSIPIRGINPASDKLYIQVNWAQWNGSPQIYNLLRGSIVGAIEKSAISISRRVDTNCYDANGNWFCNVPNYVGIILPDGASMGVSLYSATAGGYFDCGASKETIASSVDALRGEVGSVFSQGAWVDVEAFCCYDGVGCRTYMPVVGKALQTSPR